MENQEFIRDYSQKAETAKEDVLSPEEAAFMKVYGDFIQVLPKKIAPEKKEAYERILSCCDQMAAEDHGKIHGKVDGKRYEAWIEVTLPCVEFSSKDRLSILNDISRSAEYIRFCVTEDGEVSLVMRLPYFDNAISEEHLDRLFQETPENP